MNEPIAVGGMLGKTVEQIIADMRAAPEMVVPRFEAPEEVTAQFAELRARLWRERIPPRFADAHLRDFFNDSKTDSALDRALTDLDAWADRAATENVVILGPVGVGKTHLAVAAARLRHGAGESVRFWPVVELLDALRPGGVANGDTAPYDMACKVLILDDLGAERPTDWTAERLYALINRRWLNELPTIVTTNLPQEEFRVAVGQRLYSRLVHGALAIRLAGTDRRRS